MEVSCPTQCMHDPTSAPLGTLILDATWAVKKSSPRTDEGETGVCLIRGGTVGSVLSYESVHGEFGGIQSTMEIHFDRFEIGRLRRVLRTCCLWR